MEEEEGGGERKKEMEGEGKWEGEASKSKSKESEWERKWIIPGLHRNKVIWAVRCVCNQEAHRTHRASILTSLLDAR